MIVHDFKLKPDEAEAWFVDDYSGGTIVSCLQCKAHTNISYKDGPNVDNLCSGCGKHLIYRPWLEW